jgi:uncharacterized protein with GYD domain
MGSSNHTCAGETPAWRPAMPRFLIQASYTAEGTKGLLKEGGSGRRTAIENMMKGLGARVEAFYYMFGESDVLVIVDGTDNVTAAAVALVVNASGAASVRTTPLLTPEEIDQATRKAISYRPPGR